MALVGMRWKSCPTHCVFLDQLRAADPPILRPACCLLSFPEGLLERAQPGVYLALEHRQL